jgi:hypothetical protein
VKIQTVWLAVFMSEAARTHNESPAHKDNQTFLRARFDLGENVKESPNHGWVFLVFESDPLAVLRFTSRSIAASMPTTE